MFPQGFPYPQIHFCEATTRVDDLATHPFMSAMYDDPVPMGDLIYDYLAREANATYGQWFLDWPGHSPPPEGAYGSMNHIPPDSPPVGYAPFPGTTNIPLFFSPPSPSFSQTSSTPSAQGDHPVSPEPSPAPEPSCRKATPVYNHVRKKWCCSVCDKRFRGKWECKRHIGITGKRAKCLACKSNLSRREDSLRRHFTKYCKGDVGKFRFEDAFIEA